MKPIIFLLSFAFLFASCSSTTKTTTGSTKDGSGYTKAIVIDKKAGPADVSEESKWLTEHYPGYTLIDQSIEHKGQNSYAVMHIKTKEGEKKYIYFDVTKFFKRP